MKLITITYKDGNTISFTGEDVHFLGDALFYDKTKTERVRVSVEGATVEVKDAPKPERNWLLVAGLCSECIYATTEQAFDSDSQIKLQDNLTSKEADELVNAINGKIDSYKF